MGPEGRRDETGKAGGARRAQEPRKATLESFCFGPRGSKKSDKFCSAFLPLSLRHRLLRTARRQGMLDALQQREQEGGGGVAGERLHPLDFYRASHAHP